MKNWSAISPYFGQLPMLQYVGVGLALILLIALLFKTYYRIDKKWLLLRLSANTLAVIALLMIYLKPLKQIELPKGTGILATMNAPLDSLISNSTEFPIFVLTDDYSKEFGSKKSPINIPHISFLKDNYPSIQSLQLYGDGLPFSYLNYLDSFEIEDFLNPLPDGLTHLNNPEEIKVGKSFIINGAYHQSEEESSSLNLLGPFGEMTLLETTQMGSNNWEKSLQINQAGNYRLSILKNEKDTLGHFGISVKAPENIRTLIINNAPTFESKYLKNYLADQGFEVAMRSSISRDKFKTDFSNQSPISLDNISNTVLRKTDLLIISASALLQMTSAERFRIQKAVKEGLGICLLLNTDLDEVSTKIRSNWLPFTLTSTSPEINLPIDKDFYVLESSPFNIGIDRNVSPLGIASSKRIFAATKPHFLGQKALMLAQNTYLLQLDGKQDTYQKVWKNIIEQVARKKINNTQWQIKNANPPLIHHPINLEFISTNLAPKPFIQKRSISYTLPPYQHPFDEERWEIVFIPKESGWHEVYLEGEEGLSFHVSEENEWQNLESTAKIQANTKYLKGQQSDSTNTLQTAKQSVAYPIWPFFLVFLVSMITLWIEEKL